MTIELAGLIVGIITSIAVIGSLIYLALQVHAGLNQQKQENFESVIDGWLGIVRAIFRDEAEHKLFARGLDDLTSLNPSEFARFHSYLIDLVFQFDRLFRLIKDKQIDEPTFMVVSDLLTQIISTPGGRDWFALAVRSNGTPPDLVAYLQDQLAGRGQDLPPLLEVQPWFRSGTT